MVCCRETVGQDAFRLTLLRPNAKAYQGGRIRPAGCLSENQNESIPPVLRLCFDDFSPVNFHGKLGGIGISCEEP